VPISLGKAYTIPVGDARGNPTWCLILPSLEAPPLRRRQRRDPNVVVPNAHVAL